MTIQWIDLVDADRLACGGKARGLARLLAAGLRVPAGLVLVGARPGDPLDELDAQLAALAPGPFAVRSSALAEDGEQASYAGQFESVLGLASAAEVRAAIERCLASATSERVRAYAGEQASPMSIVIQRMVDARVAGVLFTVEPTSGAKDRWTIEAVQGLGEALVSGHARPDRHVVDPAAPTRELVRELAGAAPVLREGELARLVEQAAKAREHIGGELDMEWAIDQAGELHWLQARPVTRVGELPLDELDTPIEPPLLGFTRYNVGEILPGAITPMTASTSVELLERGMQRFYRRLGIFTTDVGPKRCVLVVGGHLFMNMHGPYLFSSLVAGASKIGSDRAIGGRIFEELEGLPPRGALRRLWTTMRLFPVLRAAQREVEAAEHELLRTLESLPSPALASLEQLMTLGERVNDAHLAASNWSGMLAGVLEGVLGDGAPLDAEQRRLFAELLGGIGAVESADIGVDLAGVAALLRADAAAREQLDALDDTSALAWLRGDASGPVGAAFQALLVRHGHRCFRELELREPSWVDDPLPLLAALRASLLAPPRTPHQARPLDSFTLPPKSAKAIRWLVPRAHAGIRLRERSKSMIVRCARAIARQVQGLGAELVARGRLAELDLVYFLTLDELRAALRDDAEPMTELARLRRRVHDRHRSLRFGMVYAARPTPLPPAPPPADARRLRGNSVSPGVVEGRARVARNLHEARSLVAGEILIVPFTDASWTPFFALASGLATEIGGTLSHGAVVARELGLPAIVDLPGATECFTTGQQVRLDADSGELVAID